MTESEVTMAKYVVVYQGGELSDADMGDDMMSAWMNWFGSLGDSVLDMGNPFSASAAVKADGTTSEARSGLQGYSIIEAESLDLAAKAVSGCPQFSYGGSVEIFEAQEM